MIEPIISWEAPEHVHTEKTSDWYWAVGIIALTATILAFIFGNVIFGLFIAIGATTLMIHASRRPRIVTCEINDRGIVIDNILYPFLSIESFWIDAHEFPAKILLKSNKFFMPYIYVQIEGVNPEDVRQVLLKYIAETEHSEPLTQKILERFGF
jgi:tRNA G37 N-methylase Trm5